MHMVPTLPPGSWPLLAQQKTVKPATIVPIPGKKMLRIRQKIAIPMCIAGMAALQALLELLFCTTTTVGAGAGAGAITTVVLFAIIAILKKVC